MNKFIDLLKTSREVKGDVEFTENRSGSVLVSTAPDGCESYATYTMVRREFKYLKNFHEDTMGAVMLNNINDFITDKVFEYAQCIPETNIVRDKLQSNLDILACLSKRVAQTDGVDILQNLFDGNNKAMIQVSNYRVFVDPEVEIIESEKSVKISYWCGLLVKDERNIAYYLPELEKAVV